MRRDEAAVQARVRQVRANMAELGDGEGASAGGADEEGGGGERAPGSGIGDDGGSRTGGGSGTGDGGTTGPYHRGAAGSRDGERAAEPGGGGFSLQNPKTEASLVSQVAAGGSPPGRGEGRHSHDGQASPTRSADSLVKEASSGSQSRGTRRVVPLPTQV